MSDAYRARHRSPAEFVGDLYRVLLRREAGAGEIEYWTGPAENCDPMDLVFQSLSSEEFRDRTLGAFPDS